VSARSGHTSHARVPLSANPLFDTMTDLSGTVGVLTGASGFLGRAVLRRLPADVTVFATYRTSDDFSEWTSTLSADVRPVQIDLAHQRLARHVTTTELDWTLSLAARVSTAASRRDPVGELTYVAGPAVNAVTGLQTRHLVHVSSGSVYESLTGELSPNRRLAPRLPYAIAKLAGELLVASYAETVPWIVRFFGAYGPGEPRFKVTRRMVEAFSRGARTFRMSGDGTNRIDPVHVDDAATALLALCASKQAPRTLDLCQGECPTMAAYAELIYQAAHPHPSTCPLELEFVGHAHEQMRGRANPAGADAVIGLERRGLQQGLKEYARWLSSRAADF
jgi:nucleoside-diphosphate-sugar epimerase